MRLTTSPSAERSPAWSPDDRWIAFERVQQTGNVAIVLIPPLGGPERTLTEMTGIAGSLAGRRTGSGLPSSAGFRDEAFEPLGDLDRNRRAPPADHAFRRSRPGAQSLGRLFARPSRRMAAPWHSPGR